jgi:uncharacterized protein
MIPIRDTPRGAIIEVRIQPRARKTAVTGFLGSTLKVALSAPPVEGRANEALVEFFSDLFRIPRSAVQILSGEHSRMKVIAITGRTAGELMPIIEETLSV